MRVRVYLEPRHCWVGVYWNRQGYGRWAYICLLPCLVIKLTWIGRRSVV